MGVGGAGQRSDNSAEFRILRFNKKWVRNAQGIWARGIAEIPRIAYTSQKSEYTSSPKVRK